MSRLAMKVETIARDHHDPRILEGRLKSQWNKFWADNREFAVDCLLLLRRVSFFHETDTAPQSKVAWMAVRGVCSHLHHAVFFSSIDEL